MRERRTCFFVFIILLFAFEPIGKFCERQSAGLVKAGDSGIAVFGVHIMAKVIYSDALGFSAVFLHILKRAMDQVAAVGAAKVELKHLLIPAAVITDRICAAIIFFSANRHTDAFTGGAVESNICERRSVDNGSKILIGLRRSLAGADINEGFSVAAASAAKISGRDKSFGVNRYASNKQHQCDNK